MLVFLIVGILGTVISAQDAIFSQINGEDQFINPANSTLSFQNPARGKIQVRYRNQWNAINSDASFRTALIQTDYRIYSTSFDQWNAGLTLFDDRSDNSSLTHNIIQASTGYTRKIFGNHGSENNSIYISAGASMSYNQIHSHLGELWFGRQFNQDQLAIDLSAFSGENSIAEMISYYSINAGLKGTYVIDQKRIVSAGLSINHLNGPEIGFNNNQTDLNSRINMLIDSEFPLNSVIQQKASIFVSIQNPSFQIVPSYKLQFLMNNEDSTMELGIGSRISNGLDKMSMDALLINFGLLSNKWGAIISYEVNVSELSAYTSGNGALELSIHYFLP